MHALAFRIATALALVASAPAPGVAPARIAPAAADPAEDAALVHLERGIAAFEAGDFARALRELTAAHDLAPDRANPYRWLALTQVQLGDCAAARAHIAGFLARVPPTDPRVPELVRARALCKGALAGDPTAAATTTTTTRARSRPLYTRWWFWTAVAGTAALAAGVGIALAADDDGAAVLPPVRCDATGCHGAR